MKRKSRPYRYYHGTTRYAAEQIQRTGIFRKGTLTRDKSLAERWVLNVMKPGRILGGAALVEITMVSPPKRQGKIPHAFDVGRTTFVPGLVSELRVKPSQIRIWKRLKNEWV